MTMTVEGVIARTNKLKNSWNKRNKKIREWYDILLLKDELKQDGMESVTTNDPRTGYNLGKHLITSSIMSHKVDDENFDTNEKSATSYIEGYVTKRHTAEEKRYRKMARQSFKGEVAGLMLATGWYSVFSMVTKDRIWSEAWSPYDVYPEFGPDGMVEVAHIFPMTPAVANRKVKVEGWKIRQAFTHNVLLRDYFTFDNDGDVAHGIVLGNELVMPMEKVPSLTKIGRLPVFMSPVGGLPDRGSISSMYQEHFGEALVATNEDLTKNYNKMLTFSQQLMRDTANPRWYEESGGETPILREEDLFKRGAIFRGGQGDKVGPLPVPPIPVELRSMMFDYQNMLQRGLFPWAIFGNIQQQMSYLAMANIASAALQVLTPYMDGLRGLFSDINDYWYSLIDKNGYRPYGFEMPENMPKEFSFDVQANIEIPGFMIQKATVSRMLNSNFRLPNSWVMDQMFPEIRDGLKAQATVRAEDAMMDPRAIMVDQIITYKQQAKDLREAGSPDHAALYEKLAASMEAQLTAPPTGRVSGNGVASQTTIPNEVLPGGASEPIEGLGRI